MLEKTILNADIRGLHADGRRLSAKICVGFACICVKNLLRVIS